MKEAIDITAYKDGVAITNTLRYSVASYVARDKGDDANLTAMLKSMMRYGASAAKYADAVK